MSEGESTSTGTRIVLHNLLRAESSPFDLAGDARSGLTADLKRLPSKYFYDARGSHLFEMITRLPEYYLTGAEAEILEREAARLVELVRPRALVEFGSGAARKTRILLDAMKARGLLEGYGPVDVSIDASRRAADALIHLYPELVVEGVIGDFEHPRNLPFAGRPRLLAFLGSTIGNLEEGNATEFLGAVRDEMTDADGVLIGFDLVKDVALVEKAYNDDAGVTADFNLNILRVLNRELGADFDLEGFRHCAIWNPERARIEMYLESLRDQSVSLPALDLEVRFAKGETVRTELSHKYTRHTVEYLLADAGLRLSWWETDTAARFALGLARTS
jgi:L-histidine N-alpha-methyltransferase